MPDHIHMLVGIPPKYSISQFMGYLKGKSALMIYDKHANLKYKYGNRHFWAEGYYVSTVGLNEATIKKYIQEQEKHDIALDKLSVKEWTEKTNAIGIMSKAGRYGGTYAHKDIAFEFGMWISPKFKLLLIKEFERLKAEEQKQIGWNAKRELSKINYRIHTDAIKNNLLPKELTKNQINFVYAEEADVLNMALFGMTAKEWRDKNPELKGNIRDYATMNELICLANLENLNSVFINEDLKQSERLEKLNKIAISQMQILNDADIKYLK